MKHTALGWRIFNLSKGFASFVRQRTRISDAGGVPNPQSGGVEQNTVVAILG
ncbi:MAG: hypothetical protein LBT43_04860 [Prevotella sp.]|nr:hypothetical protein [Prevotella sp.]